MKMRLPILLLLSALIFISCTGELSAANTKPSDCISITNFYPRAPDDVTYYSFGNPIELFYDYMPYFRGFIPPGTAVIDLLILENGKQKAVARHKIPPTGLPQFPPTGYTPESGFTLSELEEKDQWATEQESYLYIVVDSIPGYLDKPRAGWLYVKVGGGGYSPVYTTSFSVMVDTKIYNEWWDTYIKNAANWKALIEDVETYVDPTSTHVLSVTPPIQTVSKDAGTTTFGVSNTGTNTVIDVPGKMPWTATVTSEGTWLSIKSGSGGSNSGTVTCAFTANTGKEARTGTIQVKADEATTDSPVFVTVTQTATALNVTPTNRDVAKEAGTTTFIVSTGTGTIPWTAAVVPGSSWLSITSGTSGSKSGTIDCAFTANTGIVPRTGKIQVTETGATGSPLEVTVTQAPTMAPPVLSVTPSNQPVSKDAGTTTFSVSNTGAGTMHWTAAVLPGSSWLSITSGSSGTDAGTITCSFTANTSPSAITGTIRVTTPGATGSPKDVTVTQAPIPPAKPTADPPSGTEFSISPAQVKVTSTSATQIYYTLTSSTDGSQPDEPSIPIPSFPLQLKGKPINGSGYSGTLDLPYIVGGLTTYTIYRVKFQGENSSGAGEVSDVLQYTVNQHTVNQPIKQAEARQKPGVDYTNLIQKQDGSIDPLKKFLIPELPATLSEYSVGDLVLEYLREQLRISNISIESRPCTSGTVLIVKDASWGGTIVPLIVEKISSNAGADTDIDKIVAPSGNIEIICRNILIVLNMAGAYEDQLTQMVVNIQGMRLEYGSGHIVVISSDSVGFSGYKLAYRYQFGAKNPSPLLSGDSYTAGLSADDSIQVNDAVPIKITYDDGTTQYLIPGIIDAGSLISQMGKDEIKTEISPITGDVKTTYKDGRTWMGLPGYVFLLQPHKDTEVRCTYTDDEIVFYSTTGTQSIYKKK